MNVLLFLAFFCFSLVFIVLISTLYNLHFEGLFANYQDNQLHGNAYKMMDDMKENLIRAGPLDERQEAWLTRRANLYGVLIQYRSADKQDVWFDTIGKFEPSSISSIYEADYIVDGEIHGFVYLASLEANRELNPIVVQYRETMNHRSKILFGLVILFSLLLSLWIARLLSRNLSYLQEQTNRIRMGKRDLSIPIRGPEEVRQFSITLQEMVKELKKQEDWRQHMMEDLTHELRAPLTSMLSQLEAIIDGIYSVNEIRIKEIYEELERLSRLINDLERLSEAESAVFSLNLKKTDMIRLVKRVYENFLSLAKHQHLAFKMTSTNVPCYLEIDRDRMVQVLANIVSNAIKYNKPGGSIVLSVTWSKDFTTIQCADTGIGISAEDLPYVFNRLYRADKSRSRFNTGVGLGLSIVKALVEAHKGTVHVESELGAGSVFTVVLPNRHSSN